jgi:hypothetical protein
MEYYIMKHTQEARVLSALESGETLTPAQIGSRFGVKNPTALITSLRAKGNAIYFNERKTRKSFYRLGKPSKAVVAVGYAVLGAAGAKMV